MSSSSLRGAAGLVVVNLGTGMVAELTARHFHQLGARVFRPKNRTGEPSTDPGPAVRAWRCGIEALDEPALQQQLMAADVCIQGGEDDADESVSHGGPIQRPPLNAFTVLLQYTGYPQGMAPGPAVDSLVQARSGLCFMEYADRPRHFAFPAPTYGAVLIGIIETWAALIERERTGRGRAVQVSLYQGAMLWCASDWMRVERPDPSSRVSVPRGVRHLTFRCADGKFVQFITANAGSLPKVQEILGIERSGGQGDRGLPRTDEGPETFFGDTPTLAKHIAQFEREPLLRAFWAAGVAAEAVLEPGGIWSDDQVRANQSLVRMDDGTTAVGCPLRFSAGEPRPEKPQEGAPVGTGTREQPDPPKVIDFGAFVAGPLASRLLADFGADVIKVEPRAGDPTRYNYGAWAYCNEGKRSLCIDLKHAASKEILRRLCASADIIQQNFRPGVAERMGIDSKSLRALREDIITLATTAYGPSGPKAQNSGFDMIMQAVCGHSVLGSGRGNLPQPYRAFIVDTGAGALGACGMLAALFERVKTGSPVAVETNLLDCSLFLMSELVKLADGEFVGAQSANSHQSGSHPSEAFYAVRDGWVAIAARSESMAKRLAMMFGLPLAHRRDWGEIERQQIADALSSLSVDEALVRLAEADVWAEPCVEDGWNRLLSAPWRESSGLVRVLSDDHYGSIAAAAPIPARSLNGASISPRSAPRLGQHTREILEELRFSTFEIDDFYRLGAVA